MGISNYSVKKPVTVIMVVLIIIMLGVVSLTNLTTDLFPSMNLPYAIVSTTYIGASPEQVEMVVTKSVESSMATVSNIKKVQSVSSEHRSMVILEFNESADMDSAIIEMRENLDMITSYMPDGVGAPMIMKINPDMMPVMNFSVSLEGKTVTDVSEWIEDVIVPRFESVEGVASVTLSGTSKNEVHIDIDEEKLAAVNSQLTKAMAAAQTAAMGQQSAVPSESSEVKSFGITKEMISGILAGQNFSMPAGYINDQGSDYLVRTGDKLEDIEAVKQLPIMVNQFTTVRLGDIAEVTVVDTSEKSYTKVNGRDAIMVSVQKQNNYATTDIADRVNSVADDIIKQYEDKGIEIVMLMDQAEYIDIVVGNVTKNLLIGAVLALLILFLFLRDLKPTVIIGIAIPISVTTAFIMIYFFDITLNVVSMGGLALGIGMLVDNSIVVIENIYRLRNSGTNAKDAAVKGARQVSGAIIASTLTTISVFLPVVFIEGFIAQIFKEMALTITFSLLASLAIALSLVPMLSSKIMKSHGDEREHRFIDALKRLYTRVLKFSLRHKVSVVLLVIILLGGSIYGSINMGTEFFPESDMGQLSVNITMPKGSEFEKTAAMMDKVDNIIKNIDGVEVTGAAIGGGMMGGFGGGGGQSSGTIYVLMHDDADVTTGEISQQIRDLTSELDCEIGVASQAMNPAAMGGSGISIIVKGSEFHILEEIANDVADMLKDIDGTVEIDNGIDKGAPEIKVTVDREKSIEKGMTTAQTFMAIRSAIAEEEKATTLSVGGRDYDVKIKSSDNEESLGIEDIKNLSLETPMGASIPVSSIASVEKQSGYSSINRTGQQRILTITAQLEEGYNIGITSEEVAKKLDEYVVPEGYAITIGGEGEQIQGAFGDLLLAMLLAVLLIYMIMAAQFQSLLYPFIVMFSIPLAFTGGFLGLILTGTPLSVVAFVGMIILAGVVVNNGIVLVDYINQLKEEGMDTFNAIIKAGNTRLRPILMTALTTILALSLLGIGIGKGAEMMQPIAITAIGGLIFSTVLTLVVVPVIYAGFDKLKGSKNPKEGV